MKNIQLLARHYIAAAIFFGLAVNVHAGILQRCDSYNWWGGPGVCFADECPENQYPKICDTQYRTWDCFSGGAWCTTANCFNVVPTGLTKSCIATDDGCACQ